jgi:hypothetical protein
MASRSIGILLPQKVLLLELLPIEVGDRTRCGSVSDARYVAIADRISSAACRYCGSVCRAGMFLHVGRNKHGSNRPDVINVIF